MHAGAVGLAGGASFRRNKASMIRCLYVAARERRWNRDRARRIADMLQRERLIRIATVGRLEAMAIQLAEIRGLPQTLEPNR